MRERDVYKNTFNLLEQGEKYIQVARKRTVVLVFGESKADKSLLVRFLAGNDENLISREIANQQNVKEYRVEERQELKDESSGFVPRLVADDSSDAVYYDFPDFPTKVSIADEIATAYYTERVISRAEAVKILFAVSYKSVTKDDKGDLKNFVDHASSLVKKLDNLGGSIGLVVTHVDTTANEESIRIMISNFNEMFYKALQNLPEYEGTDHQINFLDILTAKNAGKIGVWRKPITAGPINAMASFQTEKRLLKTLVMKNLRYALIGKDDFGYKLSAFSEPYVPGLAKEIASEIGDQLIGLFRELENSYNDIDELNSAFKEANNVIYRNQNEEPLGVLKRSLLALDKVKFSVPKDKLARLVNAGKYLKFLERVYGQSTNDLGAHLSNFRKYLENSEVWYWSLSRVLTSTLASNDIQEKPATEKAKLLLAEANELRNSISNHGTIIGIYSNFDFSRMKSTIVNFKEFIKMPQSHLHGSTITFEAEEKKKAFLSKVVDIILGESSGSVTCRDNKLTISGRFVRASEIAEGVKACSGELEEVQLFAIQKLFLDTDLDFSGKEIQLSFIAPEWEVIGNRKIILNGRAGEPLEKIVESQNVLEGSDGKPGEPGKAGGPAGQFVGVVENCMNCNQMTVSLTGGEGGPGQDGGKGAKGRDGERPYDPTLDSSFTSMEDRWAARGYLSNKEGKLSKPYCWTTARPFPDEEYVCYVRGEVGQKGGRGGDGGKGGLSGVAGNYVIVNLKHSVAPIFKKEQGKTGAAGRRGIPGAGGKHGDTYILEGRRNFIDDKVGGWLFSKTGQYVTNSSFPLRGDEGLDGHNGDETKMMKNRRTLVNIDQSTPVSNYKAFLRSKLGTTLLPRKSRTFLTQLMNDERVTDIYNVLGLVKDIQVLEDQFSDLLQNNIPLLPYYSNLQERVYKYAQDLSKTGENDNDHKLALVYLYSLILIKIRNVSNKHNDGLVMDISAHIQQAMREIDDLKKKSEAVYRNKNKQNYMGEIESKINEADNLINDVVEPAIKKSIAETDEQITSLIHETMEFKETAQQQQDQLILKQQTLKDQLVLRYLLGTVQVASQLLALAGPVGATVGTAIGGVTQVAQGLLLTDDDGNHNFKDIPEGAKKTYDAISEHFKQKKKAFEEQLDDAGKTLDNLNKDEQNDNSIKKIRAGIKEAKEELAKHKTREDDFIDPEALDNMYNARNKLTKLMDEEKELLSKSPSKTESLLKKIDLVGKAKIIFEAGKVAKGVYDEILKSQKSIDKLGDSIKKASDDITKLEKQEKKLHETIKQTCEGLRKSVDNIRESASGKSHAALDISKWQIQRNLRDISQKLKVMTDGYKAQGKLLSLINQVEDGMNTMIQIYDRIQEYQETAQLADYLSSTSINGGSLGSIKNDKLRSAVNYLDQNMQFNMVLNQYEKSINALKLSVFPLAGNYTRLPKEEFTFKYDETKSYKIESLVESMKGEFSSILNELGKDVSNSRPIHRCTHKNQPYMKHHKPFFTWKFAANDTNIAELLKGREIVLSADVAAEQVERFQQDAIKFSMIGIKLRLPGLKADQDLLNRYLTGFKVNMTHQGHSHYSCCKKSFTINHDIQVIETYINKDTPEEQIGNEQFDQLKNSRALLSPYTTWKLNLFEDTTAKGPVPSLLKLQNLIRNKAVEVDLEGKGSFISRGYPADELICNTWKITEFYQEDHPNEENIQQVESDLIDFLDHEETIRSLLPSPDDETPKSPADSIIQMSTAAVKYLNPANWFVDDDVGQKIPDALHVGVTASATETPFSDTPAKLITYSQAPTADGQVNTDLMNMQSNLILMGLLVPKTKVRSKRSRTLDTLSDHFAHDMAYRAYIPSDSSK